MFDRFEFFKGCAVGILLVFAAAIIINLVRKGNKKCEYDERQIWARNKAYKAAFFTLMSYSLINGIVCSVLEIQWCDTFTGAFLGVCLSATVFAFICIFNDAYVSFQENIIQYMILLALIVLMNLVVGFMNVFKSNQVLVQHGQLTYPSLNFICAIMMIVLLSAMITKHIRDKKSGELE